MPSGGAMPNPVMDSWRKINNRNPYTFYHAIGGQGWVDDTIEDRRGATLTYAPPMSYTSLTHPLPERYRESAWIVNYVQARPWLSGERSFERFEDAYQKFEQVCDDWGLAW